MLALALAVNVLAWLLMGGVGVYLVRMHRSLPLEQQDIRRRITVQRELALNPKENHREGANA